MSRLLLIPILFSFVQIALGTPAYLDCNILKDEKPYLFSVMVDESTGKVTHTDAAESFNTEGFYSPNSIAYQRVQIGGGVLITYAYAINRENLSINQTLTMKPANPAYIEKIPAKTFTSNGTCDIAKPIKRKI
jgi:hypothetical protein